MSFELENPEIAELVDQYKQGYIGYGEAKDRVVLRMAEEVTKDNVMFSGISDEQYNNFCQKAKELLLGKEN